MRDAEAEDNLFVSLMQDNILSFPCVVPPALEKLMRDTFRARIMQKYDDPEATSLLNAIHVDHDVDSRQLSEHVTDPDSLVRHTSAQSAFRKTASPLISKLSM